KALEAFDKALEINPGEIDALHYKVSIYMQKRKIAKALEACTSHRQKLSPMAPELGLVDLIQGRIFRTAGNIEKAKIFFEKAIEKTPSLTAPLEELAFIHEHQKDIAGAIDYFERLLRLKPEYLPTYMHLSRIYNNQGDLKNVQKYLRDVLSIKNDFAPAANQLAAILAETEASIYEALRLAKMARDKDPKNPDYLDTLGWIYFLQGSNDLALRELEESIDVNPDNPLAHYHLGWAYYEINKFELARKHMAKALELDPEFKEADKARDILGE
ncbi:MAG: hypothetical protein B6230_02275, partial [Desulfobacteraceae bacterium 4572_89]